MKKLILTMLVFSVMLFAQEPAEVKPIELSKVDRLELSGLIKDVLIANQQIQLLQAQRDAKQTELQEAFEELQAKYKAPADKFNFDAATFSFVLIPVEVKEE